MTVVSEADDQGHYFFARWRLDPEEGYVPEFFMGQPFQVDYVDLRDPADVSGWAFVRSPVGPPEVTAPEGVIYAGRTLLAPLPPATRTQLRSTLGIRGQITTVKDVLRFMLLTESGERGKPGRLQPEPDGGLYVYLGDLRVDLSTGA